MMIIYILFGKNFFQKLCLFSAAVFFLTYCATPFSAHAISEEQRRIYLQNILYYDVDLCSGDDNAEASSVAAGTGAADGATFPNLEPAAMATAINKYIKQQNSSSKLKGLGQTIVAGAENSNVSPFLIVAIAQKESGLAGPSDFNVKNGNNAFGRTAAPGQPQFQGARAWYKWSSMKASVDHTAAENKGARGGGDIAAYIRVQYPQDLDSGDIAGFFKKYAPEFENDTAKYIKDVGMGVDKMVQLTKESGGDTGNVTTDTKAKARSVFMLGDSITVGAEDKLKKSFSKKSMSLEINASGGRSITTAGSTGDKTSGLQAVKDDGPSDKFAKADAIVIALGTNNNNNFESSMKTLIADVKKHNGQADLYWVNIFSKVAHRTTNNQIIEKVSASNSVRIINASEAGIPTLSGADKNVHPTAAGQQKFADVVAGGVKFISDAAAPAQLDESCCIENNGAGTGTVLPGKNNGEKIWNFLVQEMNLSNIQAAGIMGNIKQESNYSPTAAYMGPINSDAYGIIQWVGNRRAALENFARENGKDKSDMGIQLRFMKKELEGSYKSTVLDPIKASTSLAAATRIWLEKYEIPCQAGPGQAACFDGEMNKRMPASQSWIDGKGDGAADGSGSAPPTTGCSEQNEKNAEGSGVAKGDFVWPLPKSVPVVSCYGQRWGKLHTGLDIASGVGTSVTAADGGTVEAAGNIDPSGFGNTVIIKHGNGKWTMYAHLSSISVNKGTKVDQGQSIGKSGGEPGSDGAGSSQGAHLHFNIQTAGGAGQGAVDPLKYLPKDGRTMNGTNCP